MCCPGSLRAARADVKRSFKTQLVDLYGFWYVQKTGKKHYMLAP
jgi:hypothetical protein